MAPNDKPLTPFVIPFNGKWRPAFDPINLEDGDMSVLTNTRYSPNGIRAIQGMTKVQTTALSSYPKIRTGAQFKKDSSGESHVFVQAFNAGETASVLYEKTDAVPGTGDFSATLVHTDASGAGIARMTPAPAGCFAYANGKETLITGGNEFKIGKFLDWDSSGGTYKYDYTNQVTNAVTTEFATCHRVAGAADANTMLLLHLDNNLTDSKTVGPHTMTGPNVTFTTSSKFGSHAAVFNGTNANITTPDSADFDLSGGTWTIDFWMSWSLIASGNTLYFQRTDDSNYMQIYFETPTWMKLRVVAAGVETVNLGFTRSFGSGYHHIAIVENGNSYAAYVDGDLVAALSSANRAANYTQPVTIGSSNLAAGAANWYNGNLDEFRISNFARWTSSFTPPTSAYGADPVSEHFIVTAIPVKGFKYYPGVVNATASVASAFYWDGAGYSAVSSLVDGTSAAGKSLAQTGTISFSDTSGVVKPRSLNGVYGYWYKLSFTNLDTTTTVYQVTANTGLVALQDLWDGIPRNPLAFQKYDGTNYADYILSLSQSYLSTDASTYYQMNGLSTTQDLEIGFTERLAGLIVVMADGKVNATANSFLSVAYWDGTQYTGVGTTQDGTASSTCSFSTSGTITWNPPAESTEQTKSIKNDNFLYYYKLSVSTTIATADVRLIRIYGITAPKTVRGFATCAMWKDRLALACEKSGRRSLVALTAQNTSVVLNGTDYFEFELGDATDVTAVGSVFNRYGGNLVDSLVCTKIGETWILDQLDARTFKKYQLSESSGCPSPHTFRICDVGLEIAPGINKHVAIWHTGTGVVMFDQNALMPIDDDIKNYWQDWRAEYINTAIVDKFSGSFDDKRKEYHLHIATGASTTLDTELVYDLVRRRWYKVDRSSGKRLLCSFPVADSLGNRFLYGADANGFAYRLENGTTFDGTAITSTVRPKPHVVGSIAHQSTVRNIRPICRSRNVTANKVTITHYSDLASSGTAVPAVSIADATHGIAAGNITKKSVVLGPAVFHEYELSLTTSDETIGMEPLAVTGFAQIDRVDAGG